MSKAVWITQDSRVLSEGRILDELHLVATAGGAATVALYDGLSTAGEPIATISAIASDVTHLTFGNGLLLNQGLYADVGSNVAGLLVVFRPSL